MTLDYCKLLPHGENKIPCGNALFLSDNVNGLFICQEFMLENCECPLGECPKYEPVGTFDCPQCAERCEMKALAGGDAT